MPKLANVVTIEVEAARRDQVVTLLLAHKARCLRDESGILQLEVLLPKEDDLKVLVYEMYQDAAASRCIGRDRLSHNGEKRLLEWW